MSFYPPPEQQSGICPPSTTEYGGRGRPGSRGGRGSRPNSRGGGGVGGGGGGAAPTMGGVPGLMPVCKFFLQGRCYFGDSCRFRHVSVEEAAAEDAAVAAAAAAAAAEMANARPASAKGGGGGGGNGNGGSGGSGGSSGASKNVREFDEFKAGAIHIAKRAQDLEPRPYDALEGPFYSLDVECVAIGHGHSDSQRYPGRVSLVMDQGAENGDLDEEDYQVLLDEFVCLEDQNVVTYMTQLTGLTPETSLDPQRTKSLEQIRTLLLEQLPTNATLVGHSIQHDIQWLGLIKGQHFKDAFDTSIIFRQRLPQNLTEAGQTVQTIREGGDSTQLNAAYPLDATGSILTSVGSTDTAHSTRSASIIKKHHKPEVDGSLDENLPFPTRYRTFSLRHCCINLLGVDIQEAAHNPVMDARYSLLLFYQYRHSPPEMLRAVRDGLHRAPPTPSFSTEHPLVDGVCMSANAYALKWSARYIWKWYQSIVQNRAK